jgi:putative heme-binding domain-containing protein
VVGDIRHPSFSINPDYITYILQTKAGQILTGVLQSEAETLRIGAANGQLTTLHRDEVEGAVSVMPDGVAAKLSAASFCDLLAYLLLPPAADASRCRGARAATPRARGGCCRPRRGQCDIDSA